GRGQGDRRRREDRRPGQPAQPRRGGRLDALRQEPSGLRAAPAAADRRRDRRRRRDPQGRGRRARRRRRLPAARRLTKRAAMSTPAFNPDLIVVFVLAAFLGLQLIRRVSTLLHSPLMSLTNAIAAVA